MFVFVLVPVETTVGPVYLGPGHGTVDGDEDRTGREEFETGEELHSRVCRDERRWNRRCPFPVTKILVSFLTEDPILKYPVSSQKFLKGWGRNFWLCHHLHKSSSLSSPRRGSVDHPNVKGWGNFNVRN